MSETRRTMMGIIAVVVCWLFAGGAFYFGRRLEREQGEGTVPTALKGVGALMLALGLARGGWILVRNGGISVPSLISLVRPPLQTSEQVQTHCLASVTAFAVDANEASYCECEIRAFEAARATDPEFNPTRTYSHYAGSSAGLRAFREEFGRCALPRIRGWLSSECTTGCSAQVTPQQTQSQQHQQQMNCSRICRCVISSGLAGQSAEDVTNLVWGSDANDATRGGFQQLFSRGMAECRTRL